MRPMKSALPHIAPGGKIVYRHSGEIDPDEIKRFLVGRFGRHYAPKK